MGWNGWGYRAQDAGCPLEFFQRFAEAIGVRALGLGEGLEPVGYFVKTFGAGDFGHAGVHVGVFVGFAGDGGLKVFSGRAEGFAGGRVAALLEVFEVAVGVSGFTLRRCAKDRGDIGVALYVRLLGEVEVALVGTGFAIEGFDEVLVRFAAFQLHGGILLVVGAVCVRTVAGKLILREPRARTLPQYLRRRDRYSGKSTSSDSSTSASAKRSAAAKSSA